MVSVLIGWSVIVAVVFAMDFLLEIRRRMTIRTQPISRADLEENATAADEYEIAFLKGGEYLARMMALEHLARSGYYEKTREGLVANTTKDRSPLTEFEKAMLTLRVSADEGEFVYSSSDETPVKAMIDKYAQRARELNLFYRRPPIASRTAMFLALAVLYILYWGKLEEWQQLAMGGLLVVTGGLLLWKRAANRPPSVMVRREGGGPAARVALSNHVLTPNGREYVAIFEKTHYPIDERLTQAISVCPCSLLD